MNKISRFFRRVAHFYKLNSLMMVTHCSAILLPLAIINTFAFVLAHDTPLCAMIPAFNFFLMIFWLPQLSAAVINAIYFSEGLTEIPLKPGKDVHVVIKPRPIEPTGEGDPRLVAISVDSPPAALWGKDTEAELLVIFESSATVRPHSQTLYLRKNEPAAPVHFELSGPNDQPLRFQVSVYLVAPVRHVLLLAQFGGKVTSSRPSRARQPQ